MKKNKEYTKCFEWIRNRISNDGPQHISDIMWYSEMSDINKSYVSYIINYDDRLIIDNENNVCLKNNTIMKQNAQPYSFGALKA